MRPATFAPVYLMIYPMLSECARKHGYAAGVHGSVGASAGSDLDLICAPWTNDAVAAEELLTGIIRYLRGVGMFFEPVSGPEQKPHGRLAWSIPLGNGAVLDVSIVPRTTPRTRPMSDVKRAGHEIAQEAFDEFDRWLGGQSEDVQELTLLQQIDLYAKRQEPAHD